MAQVQFWIQIENHSWDVCPKNIDRMMGIQIHDPATAPAMLLKSPVTGTSRSPKMFKPLGADALILRAYTPQWTAPADKRVNPWDMNEPDPTDAGTMGTIPGATIECSVGDSVIVHFRNMDTRLDPNGKLLPVERRTHSLHPHGFVFDPTNDGAFPMSPPSSQAIPVSEAAAWNSLPASIRPTGGFKIGDRVPPGGTFDYTWNTIGWPTTQGVWLYHDHSICADENINQGAIGTVVIHPTDSQDTAPPDLPNGSATGSVVDPNGNSITPNNAQYLLLFHELGDVGMCINGRKFLGNTPTLITGASTLIRFGVVGMGSDTHTFHLHGHRWVIPGPSGITPATIQSSPQQQPVSQFEDTRLFGPANSFSFTIKKGTTFMDSLPGSLGEFHLHCHVLAHMADGMMGSLLVVQAGSPPPTLQMGIMCPPIPPLAVTVVAGPKTVPVHIKNFLFDPDPVNLNAGDTVNWIWDANDHSTTSDTAIWDSGVHNTGFSFSQKFPTAGTFPYFCSRHGGPGGIGMHGTIIVH